MSKAMTYVNASLGSTGFCVIHSRVAYRLMPDSWADAMDANYDLKHKSLPAKLGSVQGCTAYLARFEGIESPLIRVLARSGDQLAQRIEWVTGFKVRQLILETDMSGEKDESNIPARKIFKQERVEGGDLHAGVITAEPGRTCKECEWASAGTGCKKAEESKIRYPALNEPRRCIAFRPGFESRDGRTGAQLWPELSTIKAIPQ